MPIPTPHITAKAGDFAPTVLMPGDPLRAKYIAEKYLTDAVLVDNVHGVQGYTGLYNGKKVSVMASGMGMPSIGIYSYELFNFYGVENIIRIGSAGIIDQSLKVRDVVAGMSCYTNSSFGKQFGFNGDCAPCADYGLLKAAVDEGERAGVNMRVGALFSSDTFYDESNPSGALEKLHVLAVEMEGAALYLNAARAGKKALVLCTISDNPVTGEGLTAQERQESLDQMIKIALEIA